MLAMSIVFLCMQLPFFSQLTDWLSREPDLKGVVNLELVGVAGHSRGAKLAALLFSSGQPSSIQHGLAGHA